MKEALNDKLNKFQNALSTHRCILKQCKNIIMKIYHMTFVILYEFYNMNCVQCGTTKKNIVCSLFVVYIIVRSQDNIIVTRYYRSKLIRLPVQWKCHRYWTRLPLVRRQPPHRYCHRLFAPALSSQMDSIQDHLQPPWFPDVSGGDL